MTDARYILAQDRLDSAQLSVDRAIVAMRALGYSTELLQDASENLKRWRRRIAADRADTMVNA